MTSETGLPSLEERIRSLEERVQQIHNRNSKVTADKAWEVSAVRRGSVAIITYLVCATLFFSLNLSTPLRSAFIPCAGYLLSTLTLPLARRWWRDSYFCADEGDSDEERP